MVRGPQFEKHVRLFGKFDEILTVHRREYVEIKCHLDATEVFIADLIACSTCFGTIMPIIRSSKVLYMVAACGIWCCGFQVVVLVWS